MIFVLSYIGCTVQGAIKLMISTFISRGCLCISNRKYFQSYKSKYSERSPFQLQVGSRQFGMQLYPNMGLFKVYKIIMSWLQAVLLFLQIRVAFYQNKLVYFSQLHGNQPNYRIHFGGLFLKALVFLNLQTHSGLFKSFFVHCSHYCCLCRSVKFSYHFVIFSQI